VSFVAKVMVMPVMIHFWWCKNYKKNIVILLLRIKLMKDPVISLFATILFQFCVFSFLVIFTGSVS